jgi:hypothetical protein
MPTNVTFEPLLSLAAHAYRKKTGKDNILIPTYNYETYSNKEGWGTTHSLRRTRQIK